MNDKDFKEVLENREFAFKIADKALKSVGFECTLLLARDGEEFGFFMPGNHIAAAHLILSALEHAPEGTLEHVLLHLNSKKVTTDEN